MAEPTSPPNGFTPHDRKSPLTDPWEPLYSRRADGAVRLGLRVAAAHTNSRGFAHGGLISALADNAMGLTCGQSLGANTTVVTVNLAVDFLGSAQIGQWLEVSPRLVRAGSTLCFVEAIVAADGVACARANATFRVVRRAPAPVA